MLKLYQFEDCLYCERVRQKLAALDLPYEKIEVDYSYARRPEVVLKYNSGQVPVLEDDGQIITDSRYIIEYLERKYGPNAPQSVDKV